MPDNFATLDALSTEELRHRAVKVAERRLDVGFFWDLLRHLRPTQAAATEDGSPGEIGGSLAQAVAAVRELAGADGFGADEPLVRAKFLDYLREHG